MCVCDYRSLVRTVTNPKGHRSEDVGKLNSVGTVVPALTHAARDSCPHNTDPNIGPVHPVVRGYHESFGNLYSPRMVAHNNIK